jgi:hypothetical protein
MRSKFRQPGIIGQTCSRAGDVLARQDNAEPLLITSYERNRDGEFVFAAREG